MFFFFQAEDGIRDLVRSRGLGDVYKRQGQSNAERLHKPEHRGKAQIAARQQQGHQRGLDKQGDPPENLSLIHI